MARRPSRTAWQDSMRGSPPRQAPRGRPGGGRRGGKRPWNGLTAEGPQDLDGVLGEGIVYELLDGDRLLHAAQLGEELLLVGAALGVGRAVGVQDGPPHVVIDVALLGVGMLDQDPDQVFL